MAQHYELHLTKYEIAGAHNLELPYESGCRNLHGHNWVVSIHIKSKTLASHGMILDFKHIKDELKKFDHAYINELVKFNPTAENMAQHFGSLVLQQAKEEGCDGVFEICCEVQESERNVASWVWSKESKSSFRKFRLTFDDGSRCLMEACNEEDAIMSFNDESRKNIKTIIEEQ